MNQSEENQYQKAASKYSVSYMSNAKWLKLFRAVISSGIVIERACWKYIDAEYIVEIPFPDEKDLEPTGFADGKFQPCEYRWLECVYIPSVFKPKTGVGYEKKQDTAALVTFLESVGKFPLEVSPEGVRILGYRA